MSNRIIDKPKKKRRWENKKEVTEVIDFISDYFPDNKDLPKKMEKVKTQQDFQNELQIWIIKQREYLEKLSGMVRAIPP